MDINKYHNSGQKANYRLTTGIYTNILIKKKPGKFYEAVYNEHEIIFEKETEKNKIRAFSKKIPG